MYFRFRVLVLTGSLVVAAASFAQASPLDPEHFLDPYQEEMSALIAQDLAALASCSGSRLDEPLSAAALVPTEPVQDLAAMTGAQADAPDPPLLTETESRQNDDTPLSAAGAFDMAAAPAETTGSVLIEASPEVLPGATADGPAALVPPGEPISLETANGVDASGEMPSNFMP